MFSGPPHRASNRSPTSSAPPRCTVSAKARSSHSWNRAPRRARNSLSPRSPDTDESVWAPLCGPLSVWAPPTRQQPTPPTTNPPARQPPTLPSCCSTSTTATSKPPASSSCRQHASHIKWLASPCGKLCVCVWWWWGGGGGGGGGVLGRVCWVGWGGGG
jgi:hypothetical protein